MEKGAGLKLLPAVLAVIAGLLATGCANIGHPSGGPRDEDPPLFVRSTPVQGAVDVNRTKMELVFNELVNVKDAFSKVVVSPPIGSTPRVSSLGRKVTVEFDSLAPNTTYTVDFADAIEDNNEGNPLQGFAYSFSTGPTLDSLRISGRVLSARDLEPAQGMLVGVHSNMADTAFTKTRFLRVAKTDDRGRFTIRGLAPGNYRVFALGDKDNDYAYSSPEEDMAFLDFTVSPSTQSAVAIDSVYDSRTGTLDTVKERARTIFLPNDILLRSFNSGLRQQYLTKYERIDSTRIFLKFNTRADSLPRVRILGDEGRSLGTLETSARLDSIVWWLTPELVRNDSIQLEVAYTRSNLNLEPEAAIDTLNFFTAKAPKPKKSKKKEKTRISAADSIAAITTNFRMISNTSQDVHLPVIFEAPTPLERFDSTAIHLSVLVDSLYKPVEGIYKFERPEPENPRKFSIDYPWEYGGKYRLEIDSVAATDIYGKTTMPVKHEFTVKQTGDYCSLLFHITGLPEGIPAFVELLNSQDALVATAKLEGADAYFPYLAPGKYYARLVIDMNGNGEYDTGNYALGLQPEVAYYYPKAINIKKNWDKEEQWSLFDTPVDQMKPVAILKNKPATDKRARNSRKEQKNVDEEEEDYFDPTANPFDPNDRKNRRNR